MAKQSDKRRKPPAHLSRRAKQWWNTVTSDFVFETASEWELLEQCAGCIQRIDESRAAIEQHGIVIKAGTGSLKPNPAVAVERDCRTLLARLFRELHISDIQQEPTNKPQPVSSRKR